MLKKKALLKPKTALNLDKKIIKDERLKQNIIISAELKELIPPLQNEERAQLEESILEHGCREALLLWERSPNEFVLIDGHNRYSICKKHRLNFNIKLTEFDSITEVKDFMIRNQLGRRNLNPEQISYLRGLRYVQEKRRKGGYQQVLSKGQNNLSTSELIAQEFKVSEKTIKRDANYAKGINKIGQLNNQLKALILKGDNQVNKQEIQLIGQQLNEQNNPFPIRSVKDIGKLAAHLKNNKEQHKYGQKERRLNSNTVAKYAIEASKDGFQLIDFLNKEVPKEHQYIHAVLSVAIHQIENSIESPKNILNEQKVQEIEGELKWLRKQLKRFQ
ncbi:hypothetical protein [Xanthovirga aplysinae]|uniref:hypothetical protein n=1 Tax=Xanthovirga aplysinae TaxID=2529853 RepID=UPI0012BBBADB|nr:hypothetical protein [Xanthovirga aplysinae]MTI30037.1 hypothetical protein [Xanthovirga aplysinae]